ncbi:hypothetical protein ccbrp13_51350 [Ktedonobacteria bacterium brp13]|nr:hypothetical protein ccbrp13_51350 [Ktedonobacteria bacterium brp13]
MAEFRWLGMQHKFDEYVKVRRDYPLIETDNLKARRSITSGSDTYSL